MPKTYASGFSLRSRSLSELGTRAHSLLSGLTADDHTQYALLAGRSSGQTLIGGTAASESLTLQSTSNATRGLIKFPDLIKYASGNQTITANTNLFNASDTITASVGSINLRILTYTGTYNATATQLFGQFQAIDTTGGIVKNDPTLTGYLPISYLFNSATTYRADTNATNQLAMRDFNGSPTFDVVNGGTLAVAEYTTLLSQVSVKTGATVATARGMWVTNSPTVTGTITTQVGVDIDPLSKAGTNIGLRNASTQVATPSVQTLTAAGNAITANATVKRLDNTSGGSLTLTSAPTIANGQDGQILVLFNSSANNVVLQDQGTLASSNLRLSATSITLGTRDNLTLMYSSTIGDWIQISNVDVL